MSERGTETDEGAIGRFSAEFRRELYAFVGPLVYVLLKEGELGVEDVVGLILEAIGEAREVFRDKGWLAFKAWWEAEGAWADRVEWTVVTGEELPSSVVLHEVLDVPALLLDDQTLHVSVPAVPLPTGDLEPDPARWRHRIRQRAAEYVGAHFIEPKGPIGRDFPVGPDLLLSGGVPRGLPAYEEAAKIARRLTSMESPDRLDYRMKHLRGGGPYFPQALLDAVAVEMSTSAPSVRRNLIKAGFELPEDLVYVLSTPRPGADGQA